MSKKLRLKGFRNVHYAKFTEGVFEAPVHLTGGKKVNIELKYESEEFESDDMIDEQEYIFAGGEGTLTLKSLLPSEYELLFGNTVDGGEVAIRTTDIASNGALIFERQLRNSHHKRLYVIYNVKFAPSSISAESVGKGGGDIDEELTFSVGESSDNLVVFFLDTLNATESQTAKIDKWFTAVQSPGQAETQVLKLAQTMPVSVTEK
ncbi:major tail protein [Terrisporobacter sp.]|uniref:major tail protein n=1 Tax=Terrisporobacter sp. TaxID=1965305 RepID=UPI002898CC62|nr:major tail protein [Terrisporobacter sp.]